VHWHPGIPQIDHYAQAHVTHIYDMMAERKTGKNLLKKMDQEFAYVRELGYNVIMSP
jgi:hypothetical protein